MMPLSNVLLFSLISLGFVSYASTHSYSGGGIMDTVWKTWSSKTSSVGYSWYNKIRDRPYCCSKGGKRFRAGIFTDPSDSCKYCVCYSSGNVACKTKSCRPARCGVDLQQMSSDRCCKKCSSKCYAVKCSRLRCPEEDQYYPKDKCCAVCKGCRYYGRHCDEGSFTDPQDACQICQCHNDGHYECKSKVCPALHCGTKLQKLSDDKCCKECSLNCTKVLCVALTCPAREQFYPADSCCPECRSCRFGGNACAVGTFKDPSDPCKICQCFPDGHVECNNRDCKPLKCGVGLQKMSTDGCCNECPLWCLSKSCPRLLCAPEDQYYPKDRCCPACKVCKYYETTCNQGPFTDPNDHCQICNCYPDGHYECNMKTCEQPKCGTKLQQLSEDKCCKKCSPDCDDNPCGSLECPVRYRFYPEDSCCMECMGCTHNGQYFPVGQFKDPKNPCQLCKCKADGTVKCQKKECEPPACDINLQKKSSDGCCYECLSVCNDQSCGTLKCPAIDQFYPESSCCKECTGCTVDGVYCPVGLYIDPKIPCVICQCYPDGHFECTNKTCESTECGVKKQVLAEDNCCKECAPECEDTNCDTLQCPVKHQYFPDDSCCAECRTCIYNGKMKDIGKFTDPNDACKICECFSDGHFECGTKACEAPECGINKQQLSSDGCCMECVSSCENKECDELKCSDEDQFYPDNRCCKECSSCKYYDNVFPVGPFTDPADACTICKCFSDGSYKCTERQCEDVQCGVNKQTLSSDGCCMECIPECDEDPCEELACQNRFFPDDSCCAECEGCEYKEIFYSVGQFIDHDDPCNVCECFTNGSFDCVNKDCVSPPCGVDLQELADDNCCMKCSLDCVLVGCGPLVCQDRFQFYPTDSCCKECSNCKYGDNIYDVGQFVDPNDPCVTCQCSPDGSVECENITCNPPQCGINKQEMASNDCCKECSSVCDTIDCRPLQCQVDDQFYPEDSCCAECRGCLFEGVYCAVGSFTDPSNVCNNCECLPDGRVECKLKDCDAPQCGVGKQKPTADGCCKECSSDCDSVTCDPIDDCPAEDRYFPADSCCQVCGCRYEGVFFEIGSFVNPDEPCKICECLADRNVECTTKNCPGLPCGTNKQVLSDDNCCMECVPECEKITCEDLTCSVKNQYYPEDSCCPVCGCRYNGSLVEEGPVGNPCEKCECKSGLIDCDTPPCPAIKLKCVDPAFDKDCNYVCPNGETCIKDGIVIKSGEYKIIGSEVCICSGGYWYPNAFCASKIIPKDLKDNLKKKCVSVDYKRK